MGILKDTEYTTLDKLGVKSNNTKAIVALCDQGDQDWFGLRCGLLTASHAKMVVTAKGKPCTGQMRQSYINGLIAEQLMGSIEMTMKDTPAMERGRNLEPRARDWYSFETGRDVKQVGFVFRDDKKECGCSPDGLCEDRNLEIKCLMHRNHIDAILKNDVPADYIPQIQFQMWVMGIMLTDFVLYTPEPNIPSLILTVESDPMFQAMLDEFVPSFCEEVQGGARKLKDMLA